MTKYWETKDGQQIEYKDLKDIHLLNILKFIEDKAKNGIIIDGGSSEPDDYWYDEISGDEVLDRYDYEELLKEAKLRKLIN